MSEHANHATGHGHATPAHSDTQPSPATQAINVRLRPLRGNAVLVFVNLLYKISGNLLRRIDGDDAVSNFKNDIALRNLYRFAFVVTDIPLKSTTEYREVVALTSITR